MRLFFDGEGELKIFFVGHGTLFIEHAGRIIHIDPWTQLADYQSLPEADIILVTHEHHDHLDAKAIEILKKQETQLVYSESCSKTVPGGIILKNFATHEIDKIKIEALPAYNVIHKRENGEPYHPKGVGNAYLLSVAGKRILIGGDTENIDELKSLKNIDIAFLPMNLPYTMTPEMTADLALAIRPGILYPYHFGDTDTDKLCKLLQSHPEIDVRIRKMQ
jgi:L-ascorbate metabolism protein UlaG (beta-lactamase superfamily)